MQDQEGRTRLDRLESRLERAIRKGRADVVAELEAELETPPFPIEISHVWSAWTRLRNRKAGGFAGPAPLEWPDIDAFCRRAQPGLTSVDIELIEELDDVYLASFSAGPSQSEQNLALRDGLKQIEHRS